MFSVEVSNCGKFAILDVRKDCDDLGLIYHTDLEGKDLKGLLEFKPAITEWLGGFSYIHNNESTFFFKTNYKAPKSRVIAIDMNNINLQNPTESMQDVIPEHATNVLNDAHCVNGKIVAFCLENASDKIKVFDFAVPANQVSEIKIYFIILYKSISIMESKSQ